MSVDSEQVIFDRARDLGPGRPLIHLQTQNDWPRNAFAFPTLAELHAD